MPRVFWVDVFALAVLGCLYPVAIYPSLLWLLARRRRRQIGAEHAIDGYSIIIPAHNEAKVIAGKLRNTLECVAAAGVPAQVIVAADGCTDATCDIVATFAPEVELVVVQERGGIVGALKSGLAYARYPVAFFSDADIRLDRDALRLMIRHFADPAVGGVCGSSRQEVLGGSGLEADQVHGRLRHWVRAYQSRLGVTIAVDGANWAVRTALLHWPTRAQLSEDLVIPLEILRRGYRFEAEPAAGAIETLPAAVSDEYHRKVRIIAGGMQAGLYCRWMFRPRHAAIAFHYLSWKASKWFVSGWVLLATVAVLMLAPTSPVFRALAVAEGVGIGVALGGGLRRRLWPAYRARVLDAAWYALMALAAPVMAATSLLARRASVLWRMAPR